VAFPTPSTSAAESADAHRDERKRQESPPSSFFAQSQAILTGVRYLEPLHSGYGGAARKHKNRAWSALLVQLMAAFEFTMKDFIAQTLDVTHIYDDEIATWDWVELNISAVLGTRDGSGKLGAVLIHPLSGWQTPEKMNSRYQDVFRRMPIANDELPYLKDLWIVRHSIAHNGGVITGPDARRLREPSLTNEQILVDLDYLENATNFLREIVGRLESVVGEALLKRWFGEAASGSWETDSVVYRPLKLLTTYVQSRPRELPEIDELDYLVDEERFS
jgi:hypothetical protein